MDESKVAEVRRGWEKLIKNYYNNDQSDFYKRSTVFDPYSQNNRLKKQRTSPQRYDRKSISKMLESPGNNERALRAASWHFYNNITPMMKQVNLYADILTYRWWLTPASNRLKNDKQERDGFMREYERSLAIIESLDPKKTFREVVLNVMREGKMAYCIKEEEDRIFLQVLPSDYTKIVYRTDIGWQVSFNMMYFSTEGVSVEFFPPAFRDLFTEFSGVVDVGSGQIKRETKIPSDVEFGRNNNNIYYWKEVPIDVATVFSFDDTIPDVIPPLSTQFIDATDLDSYKILQQQLLELPLNQIMTATIPFKTNQKSGSYSDDTAISPELLVIYENAIRASLPDTMDFVAAPFDNFNLFNFDDTMNRNNVVGNAITNFYNESLGGLINTSDKPSMSAIRTQQKIETRLIDKIYGQFSVFVNHTLRRKGIRRIKFHIDGNVFEDKEKLDNIKGSISSGNSPMYFEYLSFFDHNLISFNNSLDIIGGLGIYEKLQVPPTSHTTPSGDGGSGPGRPSKDIEDMTSEGSIASAERELNTAEGRGLT